MPARLASATRAFLAPILGDRSGVAAVFLAVALVPMIGAVGLAIDSSLGYLLKARMSKSLDAAGLAAGRKALDADAEDIARAYFDANFGENYGDIVVTDFDFELDDEQRHVTLSAVATTPTYFMRVFGHDQMTVAARTVIERQTTGMELALVMDNTGSMNGSAFDAMQAAAYELIDIIFGEDDEVDNVWVSLVPYTATVNIGTGHSGWLAATDRVFTNPASFRPDLTGGGWKGCVMGQAMPYDADDTTPASRPLTSFYYAATPGRTADNDWPDQAGEEATLSIKPNRIYNGDVNAGRGPNLGCGPAMTPLTASRSAIDTAIGNMGAWGRGGTTSNLGLTWGWRTISPSWRGLWGNPGLPLDYGTDFMDKVVVLLTDGNNQFHDNDSNAIPGSDFTAYGRIETLLGYSTGTAAARRTAGKTILDGRMAATCGALKAQRVKIYTIIFGGAPDASTRTLYENCATSPAMYYYAPNNAAIASAFRAIGGQLANLLIVE